MNKYKTVILTLVFVSIAYLLMIVFVPILGDFAGSANATMAASSNMANYPGTSGFLLATPWIMWFVPGAIALIVIIITLKKG